MGGGKTERTDDFNARPRPALSPEERESALDVFWLSKASITNEACGYHCGGRMFLPLLGGEGGVRAVVPSLFPPFEQLSRRFPPHIQNSEVIERLAQECEVLPFTR